MNVKFNVSLDSSNAAFQDGVITEITRILDGIVDKMWNGQEGGPVRDSNGNKVGEWNVKVTYDDDDMEADND